MTIELEFPASSLPEEEICSFTLWLPQENANTPEFRRAMEDAEQVMTGLPPQCADLPAPAADGFLGQWL